MAVGKTSLINHLCFKSSHQSFRFATPYTTRAVFDKTEEENRDYIKAPEAMFTSERHEWYLREEFESLTPQQQVMSHKVEPPHIPYLQNEAREEREQKIKSHIGEIFGSLGGAKRPTVYDTLVRGKVYSGVLEADVANLRASHFIPVIECSYLAKAQEIHREHEDANFIYIQPKSIEDLTNRIIRKRPGTETQDSLNNKMSYAYKEIEHARGLDFINHIFTNDDLKEFLDKAGAHLVHHVYKL